MSYVLESFPSDAVKAKLEHAQDKLGEAAVWALGTIGVANLAIIREVEGSGDELISYAAGGSAAILGYAAFRSFRTGRKIKKEAAAQDSSEQNELRAQLRESDPTALWYQNPDNPDDYEYIDGSMSHAALVRTFMEQTKGSSTLVEPPMDTGLWPTAPLSDAEHQFLSDALAQVPRSALRRKASE